MVSTNVSQTAHDKIAVIGKKARAASLIMAKASSKQKNNVLLTLTDLLGKNLEDLLKANNLDIVEAEKNGLSKAFIDRLTISVDTVAQMAAGLRQIASLRDPIGEITDVRPQPSGIEVGKMRVPLGVVAIIYESRPNVTIDAAALCLKSGNAAVLRGGSDAKHSNAFLAGLIQQALSENSITSDAVQIITDPDRELVGELITAREYIDVLIPRGGKGLISRLMQEATVPMIKHLEGICHTYVDESADTIWQSPSATMPKRSAILPATPWKRCWSTEKLPERSCRRSARSISRKAWSFAAIRLLKPSWKISVRLKT